MRVVNAPANEDVEGSYSADVLAYGNAVRKPFQFEGAEWTATALIWHSDNRTAVAYRLVPKAAYDADGDAQTGNWETHGSYHGWRVADKWVLLGPPVRFVGTTPRQPRPMPWDTKLRQLSLF